MSRHFLATVHAEFLPETRPDPVLLYTGFYALRLVESQVESAVHTGLVCKLTQELRTLFNAEIHLQRVHIEKITEHALVENISVNGFTFY